MGGSHSSAVPAPLVVGRTTDLASDEHLLHLADVESPCAVSLYLPTHRAGRAVTEDRIRLKNLLAEATAEMASLECRAALLAPAQSLLDDADFWAHGDEGLVVLAEPHRTTVLRSPEPFDELAVVADRFHLKPLLREVATRRVFHVLAISHKHVRLLRATPAGASEVAVDDLPSGSADVLQWDDREPQLHSHGAGRVGGGRVAAAFHGQGGAKDVRTADAERYLHAVDRAVVGHLGVSGGPLVLAGVGELVADYRRISRYRSIVDGSVPGNPDELTISELHERASHLVESIPDRDRQAASEQFVGGTGPTVDTVVEAVVAAAGGRVSAIFVPDDRTCWGRHDPHAGSADAHESRRAGDRDLFDVAAIETLRHRGEAFVVPAEQVPGSGEVAALLRF
jgi:hypothetical protein